MAKVVRLNENDIERLIKKIITEESITDTEDSKIKKIKQDVIRTINQEVSSPDFENNKSSSRPKSLLEILKDLESIIDSYANRTPNGLKLK